MSQNVVQLGEIEGISLVGFRLSPDSENPDWYTLFTYGEEDIPIRDNDRLVFFKSVDLIDRAYAMFDNSIKRLYPPPSEIDLVCDVADMLYVVNHQDSDGSATILNGLNTIFDLLKAIRMSLPAEYKDILYRFADHLTFNREFGAYLSQNAVTRQAITNAILWAIGAITVRSRIVE
jgi:hypothetical protein